MTTLTTDIHTTDRGLRTRFASFLTSLSRALEAHAHFASRRDQIEALEAKSDAELAEIGVKREQIVHYVYRDLFYA
ncbi:hypothetical protein FDP25_03325 [Roseovarius sp. A21]|uniref:DUF1127 domain-containing protein n=1 Tax=Roseovarius bejariae TaxID=2576383 RepID=A0A844CIF2_9RHOB|nr:hypothetical protein [Roseovarius bejariae]MRU14457.1 hypothetical protein [Roseovarius bejariae]